MKEEVLNKQKLNVPKKVDFEEKLKDFDKVDFESYIDDETAKYLEALDNQLNLNVRNLRTTNIDTIIVPLETYKMLCNYKKETEEKDNYINVYLENEKKYNYYISQLESRKNDLENKINGLNTRTRMLKHKIATDVVKYFEDIYNNKKIYNPEEIIKIIMNEQLPSEQTLKVRKTRFINTQQSNKIENKQTVTNTLGGN